MAYSDKTSIYTRLKRADLSAPADALRNALVHIFKAENATAETKVPGRQLVDKAWKEMGEVFARPLERVEQLKADSKQAKEESKQAKAESKQAKAELKQAKAELKQANNMKANNMNPESTFQGYTGEPDDIVDPTYQEPDAGKRLRDAFLWVGDEFRRITSDLPDDSTVMDFGKAATPPPTVLAIQIAEEYGRCSPGKRRELFARLTSFAVKSHAPKQDPEESDTNEADAILAALEEDTPYPNPTTT